tara:strand:- start:529 stop:933 length:405 start_codon:yes stop_codon:yes gene_type:complete
MNKVLIVHTSWYEDYISTMVDTSIKSLEKDFEYDIVIAPGSIELAALAKNKILQKKYVGILFLGIVIRGETSHYDLVTNETFRSIGSLAENFYDLAIINNVICVENEDQLKERLIKSTLNNTNALIDLINEKSS